MSHFVAVVHGVCYPDSDPPNSRFIRQVWVNQYNVLHNNVPFGGKKQSGIGTTFFPYDVPVLLTNELVERS